MRSVAPSSDLNGGGVSRPSLPSLLPSLPSLPPSLPSLSLSLSLSFYLLIHSLSPPPFVCPFFLTPSSFLSRAAAVSCPGDYCYYDSVTNEQICKHCCAAEYEHYDNETYLPQERKVPCDATHPGESHGICDGFGSCQCAPPFLTMDCSVRDCPNNCSGNGWCSVEYPVSRCMCDPGWIGSDCASRLCLNNCSWPNGFCQSGVCNCTMNPNPFNRSQDYHPFYGDDCSYVVPFAAAPSSYLGPVALLFVSLAAWTLACADETVLEQRRGQRRRRREEDGETGREQERGEERESGCGA